MDGTSARRHDHLKAWSALPQIEMPQKAALRALIADDHGPERSRSYDLLRTRMLPEVTERGWTRIGVSQASPGPASSLTALNLALSEARRPDRHVLLIDLDIAHQPVLARFGQAGAPAGPLFRACTVTPRLAFATVQAAPDLAAITLLSPQFQQALSEMIMGMAADVTILHLPPCLSDDAGLAALPLVDTVLLTIDGRRDTAADLRRCEAHVTRHCPVLGLFLHNAEA